MDTTKEMLNQTLVKIFNQILFNEEEYLKKNLTSNITVRSVHILEAINTAAENGEPGSKKVASILGITPGTLSVALKKLINQGYVTKKQSKTDKRIYNIALTPSGKNVCKVHAEYHQAMIDIVTRNLSAKEEAALVDLLSKIKYFFLP